MRVPLSWLAEYVELACEITPEQIHADLVRVGFEEEDLHTFGVTGPLVVGKVLTRVPEPQTNGKTINWCQVQVAPDGQNAADGGAAVRGIVCGAHNFEAGDKVVVSLPGAVLPGDFRIAARKTYGHISDGMIASERELGLGEDHDGIIVLSRLGLDPEVGTDAAKLLGLTDFAVEINVTPDRGYALSIRGVAREYSHSTGAKYTDPVSTVNPTRADGFKVVIDDTAPIRGQVGSSVFVTRVVRGIDAKLPTPGWMLSRLKLSGIRSISLAVDITNYVMLEFGQPLHGYDLDKLQGKLTVRRAVSGEEFTTLDGINRKLNPEDLLICDDSGAIGLAGVMGGLATELSLDTQNVLIEAANFDSVSIARTARRHKLPSEASKRFERGVDPQVAEAAAAKAVQLLVELAGGTVDTLGSYYYAAADSKSIELPLDYPTKLIGYEYTAEQVERSLSTIGCECVVSGKNLSVTPPSWRKDLVSKVDLVEEVARIVGYDSIPATLPVAPPGKGLTLAQKGRRRVSNQLASAGFTEVIAYPFLASGVNRKFSVAQAEIAEVKLSNTLDGERPYLRSSLLPGLLQVAHRNLSRGLTDLALFEQGIVFLPELGKNYGHLELPAGRVEPTAKQLADMAQAIVPQQRKLAVVLVGNAIAKQPNQPAVSYDWQDALNAVAKIAQSLGLDMKIQQGKHAAFHPGRTAEILLGAEIVGYAGELLPALAEENHLPRQVAALELSLDALFAASGTDVVAHEISGQPAATQDVSLVVAESVTSQDLKAALILGAGELLEDVSLVDIYRGTGIAAGYKSVTYALRFRAADRTLTQEEATEAKLAGVAEAAKQFGASLRD